MSRLSLAVLAVAFFSGTASAQPPAGPPVHVERRSTVLDGGATARLVTRWGLDASSSGASVTIAETTPTLLVRGATAGAIERGERVALVAYESFGDGAPFRVRAIRRDAGHDVIGPELALPRPGSRADDVPFAVAIAPVPGRGFAVFFEEVQQDDPSAAHTYLFMLDLDGAQPDAGREIPVPWPIGAAIWNGHGFHLALLYPGSGGGMRLSMVSLSPEGTNQQHPDWASAAGFVGDVHLVREGDHIRAHYRGGHGGGHWIESDVTEIRGWGSEPPAPHDHGALETDVTLAIDAAGHVQRVPSRADGLD
jgi:hypothetical protein